MLDQDLAEAAVPGMCFQFAMRLGKLLFRESNEQARVVHGTVKPMDKRFHHAWVEKDGMIYDNNVPEGMPRKDYYSTFHPRKQRAYTPEQTVVNCLRNGHYGPWEN